MLIIGKNGLSGIVKKMLDLIFIGGAGILISLPYSLKWYMTFIDRDNNENYRFLLGFLYVTGIVCLVLVNEIRKIFKSLDKVTPFMMDNVKSLNRIAACGFIIAAAYIVKIFFYNSVLTAVLAMAFIIGGLFAVVLAEVFRQAVEAKEENDLTI